MQFIDPRTDFAFKRIFGSLEGQGALISLINGVLGLEGEEAIVEVTLVDPYQAPPVADLKRSFLDVKAVDGRGVQYLIEMQVEPVKEFAKRLVYNASKAYTGQLKRGAEYTTLVQVVAITFCDFVMFPEFTHYLSEHRVREKVTHEAYLDEIRYYFIELPKFTLDENQLETAVEKWCFFLKHSHALDHIPQSLASEPYQTAFRIAERSNLTREEWAAYDEASVYMQDQKGKIEYAREAGRREGEQIGLEKGEQIGLEKGEQIGRVEERRVLVRRMREAGFSEEDIAKVTESDG